LYENGEGGKLKRNGGPCPSYSKSLLGTRSQEIPVHHDSSKVRKSENSRELDSVHTATLARPLPGRNQPKGRGQRDGKHKAKLISSTLGVVVLRVSLCKKDRARSTQLLGSGPGQVRGSRDSGLVRTGSRSNPRQTKLAVI